MNMNDIESKLKGGFLLQQQNLQHNYRPFTVIQTIQCHIYIIMMYNKSAGIQHKYVLLANLDQYMCNIS